MTSTAMPSFKPPPPPPGGKSAVKRNPFLRALAEKKSSTEEKVNSPRLTLENLYIDKSTALNQNIASEVVHHHNNNNEEEDDDDDDVEVVDEDISGAKSSKSKKLKSVVVPTNIPPPPPSLPSTVAHTKDKIDMYLAQRKQDLMKEEEELAAADDFEARRQSSFDTTLSMTQRPDSIAGSSAGVSYDESYTQLYRKSSSDVRSEKSFVAIDGEFAPEGNALANDQQWEPAADEEKAKYLSQRYLMLQKRASMEVTDLEELIGNWNGQTELIKEVHNAIFQADLQRFKNIRQKFNNFAFMRDATLNTVFHTAAINPNLTILAALGDCLDRSEFGTKVFPDTPLQDKALVRDVYQQAQLWRNVPEKSTPCYKAGWLYKRRKGNDWKRRWCTLHPTMLIYRTSPEDLAIKGTVPLDDCSVQVLTQPASKKTKEVSMFEIHTGDGGKKSWISFGTNKESMIFRAETELDSQEWLCYLRAITGNIQPIVGLVPNRFANIEARAVLLNYPNIAGDTPLHILARTAVANKLSAEDDEKMDLLHTAQYFIHSECDPFALNREGVTAADISSDSELHEWLKKMTEQLVKNDTTSHSLPLLQPPLRVPGYSYVSLLLHKHTYSDTASKNSKFDTFEHVKLTMGVFSPSGLEIDRQQCVSEPLFRRRKALFWGRNFHLQLPLENMPDKSYIEISLLGIPYGANPVPIEAKGLFTMNLGSICSAALDMPLNTIPALSRPVTAGKGEVSAPAPSQFQLDSISHTVLNFSVSVTKINV